MEQLLFSLNATIPVFLVMVIGYVLQQLHVTNDSFVKTLNSFNYKITLPVLLFKDMSTADFYSVWDTGYVLFCFFVTLFCIDITWVVAGIFYKNKSRLGELVQASYRSSAAVLGIAFIQNIYGNSGMAPLMIVGTVPLYNIAAVLILSFTGPDAKGFDKESLLRLGFFLGKFIYLLDAYEDIEQDLKKGTYNPLKKRYEEPGFEEECRQILTMMMSECCKEFEQLPILQNVDILRNILYSGVWCRYEIVRKKRMKDSAKEVTGNDL